MNTPENVSFGSGLAPSGSEVESAMFRPEVVKGSDFRNRIEDLKALGISKVTDVQRVVRDRSSMMKRNARRSMQARMAKMQTSMQTNPTKWVAIAAGTGFALGMLGRVMRWRGSQRSYMPQLIVIESHI